MEFPIKFDTVKSEWSVVYTSAQAIKCYNFQHSHTGMSTFTNHLH